MSSAVSTSTPAIPAPRPAAEQAPPRRRQRPPSQYWDVFECCWRVRSEPPTAP